MSVIARSALSFKEGPGGEADLWLACGKNGRGIAAARLKSNAA
jgi:hypothetical protein